MWCRFGDDFIYTAELSSYLLQIDVRVCEHVTKTRQRYTHNQSCRPAESLGKKVYQRPLSLLPYLQAFFTAADQSKWRWFFECKVLVRYTVVWLFLFSILRITAILHNHVVLGLAHSFDSLFILRLTHMLLENSPTCSSGYNIFFLLRPRTLKWLLLHHWGNRSSHIDQVNKKSLRWSKEWMEMGMF